MDRRRLLRSTFCGLAATVAGCVEAVSPESGAPTENTMGGDGPTTPTDGNSPQTIENDDTGPVSIDSQYWPLLQGRPTRDGFVGSTSATKKPTVKWSVNLPKSPASGVFLGHSAIYVSDGQAVQKLARDDGTLGWRQAICSGEGICLRNGLFIGEHLYAGGMSGLTAVDSETGEPQWDVQFSGDTTGNLPIPLDTGIVTLAGTTVRQFTPSGEPSGQLETPSDHLTTPPSTDGTRVYCGGSSDVPADRPNGTATGLGEATVYGLEPREGAVAWEHATQYERITTPVTVGQSTVYTFAGDSGRETPDELIAIDRQTGRQRWSREMETSATHPLSLGQQHLYATVAGEIWAVTLTEGADVWRFTTETDPTTPPIVLSETVVVGDRGGRLYGINRETGKQRWTMNLGGWARPPSAGREHLYVPHGSTVSALGIRQ